MLWLVALVQHPLTRLQTHGERGHLSSHEGLRRFNGALGVPGARLLKIEDLRRQPPDHISLMHPGLAVDLDRALANIEVEERVSRLLEERLDRGEHQRCVSRGNNLNLQGRLQTAKHLEEGGEQHALPLRDVAVDALALGEQLIQLHLAQDGAQRRLRELAGGVQEAPYLILSWILWTLGLLAVGGLWRQRLG